MAFPTIGAEFYLKYRIWWDDLAAAKKKFPDVNKLVVKGIVVAADFEAKMATICFPAIFETREEKFAFFSRSNSTIQTSILTSRGQKELSSKEFLHCSGTVAMIDDNFSSPNIE
jgi:hypothetical protein